MYFAEFGQVGVSTGYHYFVNAIAGMAQSSGAVSTGVEGLSKLNYHFVSPYMTDCLLASS